MPIYEYRCRKCGHTLEKIQKLGDPLLTQCPSCRGPLEKLISAAAVQFKGGGWYADGYAGKGAAKSGGSDSEGGAKKEDGGGKKGGSGETKKAAAGGCGSGSCGCH